MKPICFFYCFILFSLSSFGLTCKDVLGEAIVMSFQDSHRIYAFGKIQNGKRKVHIIEIEGTDLSTKALLRTAQRKVLKRENWGLFHEKLSTIEGLFEFRIPEDPAFTRLEIEGKGGKRVRAMITRTYQRRNLEKNKAIQIPEFGFGAINSPKILVSIEVRSSHGVFDLIFNVRTEPKNIERFTYMYGLHLVSKMGLGTVAFENPKFYGEVD